jgi:hypothetical protein
VELRDVGRLRFGRDAHDDRSELGELERVPDEVQDDLPYAAWIPDQRIGRIPGDVDGELQALLMGAEGQWLQRVAQCRAEGELRRIKLEPARLDLGEIEDVVDEVEEGIG